MICNSQQLTGILQNSCSKICCKILWEKLMFEFILSNSTSCRPVTLLNVTLLKRMYFLFQLKLKSYSHLPKKSLFTCFDEILLKMMKNAFYFILKALSFRKIFKFLSRQFGHVEETA